MHFCLYLSQITVTAQPFFFGNPGFFVLASFDGQAVVTESVLGQDLPLLCISNSEEIFCWSKVSF